jgi:signal transduction histidine kinase
MAPVALDELVRHVVDLESSEFQREGVSLSLEIAPDLPIFTLDSMRIEQVCHYVLRYARQACSQGGRVEVQVSPKGISVEDDGKGMSEETLARLFTPFFTTKPQGTGLGLCVASKIVDAHGGHIVVESAEGKGTRFRIELEPGHKEE